MARLAVIGGGLAGAALVLALRREGQDQVTWYAADDGQRAYGTADFLQLPPNATRVLQALGLRSQLEAFDLEPQSLLHRAADNSFVWADLPLGSFVVDRFKAPFLCAHSTVLLDLLRAEGAALTGDLRTHRPQSVDANGTVHEADGQARKYDLVVIAAGADTALLWQREDTPPPSATSSLYQGSRPLKSLPVALAQSVLTRWSHPLFDLWTLPDHRNDQLLLQLRPAACDPASASAERSTTGNPGPALTAALPDWAAGRWQHLQQRTTPGLAPRYRGQLVLCGNAAHQLPLHTALGPALALEDAWVLSRLIEQNEGSLEAVGPEFERYRAPRTRQFVQRTAQERASWYAAALPARAVHRLRSLLAHRFLPEFAYQELDWLYGYDCVRGFR